MSRQRGDLLTYAHARDALEVNVRAKTDVPTMINFNFLSSVSF
ncbi:hypothetical protein ACV229_38735 [Burkholderia sp. MR1-5-21]